MTEHTPEEILSFWFPPQPARTHEEQARRCEWWMRGGANAEIIARFTGLTERAARGDFDAWSEEPRSRLALILVLDQFSRTVYAGTPRAYAQDRKARAHTYEGLANGHYDRLEDPWEKTFFYLPLGHSESVEDLNRAVMLADELLREAPEAQRRMLEFSANQARGHRDTLVRFGRHPHRNAILGRRSTPEEMAYIEEGRFVHQRPVPR